MDLINSSTPRHPHLVSQLLVHGYHEGNFGYAAGPRDAC